MRYVYGPVRSRRLGLSLGITTVEYKVCNFNCLYCQLGKTTLKTNVQKEYVAINDIMNELKESLLQYSADEPSLNYITLSGFGEPTLNIKTSELIKNIKKLTNIPVAVLTNSALLVKKTGRLQTLDADVICPTLNAADEETFYKINRPYRGIKVKDIINGLCALRREFKGKIFLEIMLVRGINDNLVSARKIAKAVELIKPDKIHLNVPVRSATEKDINPPNEERLKEIKEIMGKNCEIYN